MATEWLFDTNVFTRYEQHFQQLRRGRLILSSVVVQELLVISEGTGRAKLMRLVGVLKEAGLVLTPSHDDWIAVGDRLRRLFAAGYKNKGTLSKDEVNLLVRDTLIAQCAIARNRFHQQNGVQSECVIVSDNIRDFEKATHGTRQKLLSGRDLFGE